MNIHPMQVDLFLSPGPTAQLVNPWNILITTTVMAVMLTHTGSKSAHF